MLRSLGTALRLSRSADYRGEAIIFRRRLSGYFDVRKLTARIFQPAAPLSKKAPFATA